MEKTVTALVFCVLLLAGCGKSDIVRTYEQSEQFGIVKTYYELSDGRWECEGKKYRFRFEFYGRMPNAEKDSYFVVLTNNIKLSFEDASKSLYSSSFEDIKKMEDSIIVKMP